LFHLLRNRLYLGKIIHKGIIHEGEHDAIIDPAKFDEAQALLDSNARRHRAKPGRQVDQAPLTGRIFYAYGQVMSPAFSRGRGGRVYPYYVSASLQQGARSKDAAADRHDIRRVPTAAIETLVSRALARLLPSIAQPMASLTGVNLSRNVITLELPATLAARARDQLAPGEAITRHGASCSVALPLALPLRGGRHSIEAGNTNER
jgi:hypothetical protein